MTGQTSRVADELGRRFRRKTNPAYQQFIGTGLGLSMVYGFATDL